ncbi:hypothetical protein YW5DRAFT_03125 [Streptomyces sp. Ncost-T6T-1]|nr:hypothetical protein YW5DRAFT_03125 [Streptomyces sp. Ncost-T6T-1]
MTRHLRKMPKTREKKGGRVTARRRGGRAHGRRQLWPQRIRHGPCLSPPSGQGTRCVSTRSAPNGAAENLPHEITRLSHRCRRGTEIAYRSRARGRWSHSITEYTGLVLGLVGVGPRCRRKGPSRKGRSPWEGGGDHEPAAQPGGRGHFAVVGARDGSYDRQAEARAPLGVGAVARSSQVPPDWSPAWGHLVIHPWANATQASFSWWGCGGVGQVRLAGSRPTAFSRLSEARAAQATTRKPTARSG